jgi:ribosomal protein L29
MNAVAKQYTQQADAASTAKLVELNDQRLQKIRGDIARAKKDAALRAKIAPLEAKLTSLIEERGNVSKRLLRIPMSDWVEGTVGKKLSAKETAYQGKINKLRREIAKVVSGGTASRTGDSTGQTGDDEQDVPEEKQANADDF